MAGSDNKEETIEPKDGEKRMTKSVTEVKTGIKTDEETDVETDIKADEETDVKTDFNSQAKSEVKHESEVLTAEDAQALAPLYSDVIKALKQVYDPEIPVNIYDLGLIYELVIDKEHDVYVKMTFTAPSCPMADEVLAEVKASVEDVPGIKSCKIDLVFDPVWDKSMLSEEARIELGLDDDE